MTGTVCCPDRVRPRLITYHQASLDGRLTLAPGVVLLRGDQRWHAMAGSAEDAYARIMQLHRPRLILEGSGSFLPDDATPQPLPEPDDAADLHRHYLPPDVVSGRKGFLAVVDSRGRIRWQYKESPEGQLAGWHLLVLVSDGTPPAYLAYLRRERIPYLVCGTQRVDLVQALDEVGARLDVRTVVASGGGRLSGAILRAGLVDEVDIEFLPYLIGGVGTPSLFDAPPLLADQLPVKLRPMAAEWDDDGRLFLRYAVDSVRS